MAKHELISTAEAARRKNCSRNAILAAIERKAIDGENLGAQYVVRANPKFERWLPSLKRQHAGRDNQEGST
jgi:hypothetical protein